MKEPYKESADHYYAAAKVYREIYLTNFNQLEQQKKDRPVPTSPGESFIQGFVEGYTEGANYDKYLKEPAENAIVNYTRALELNPNHINARYELCLMIYVTPTPKNVLYAQYDTLKTIDPEKAKEIAEKCNVPETDYLRRNREYTFIGIGCSYWRPNLMHYHYERTGLTYAVDSMKLNLYGIDANLGMCSNHWLTYLKGKYAFGSSSKPLTKYTSFSANDSITGYHAWDINIDGNYMPIRFGFDPYVGIGVGLGKLSYTSKNKIETSTNWSFSWQAGLLLGPFEHINIACEYKRKYDSLKGGNVFSVGIGYSYN